MENLREQIEDGVDRQKMGMCPEGATTQTCSEIKIVCHDCWTNYYLKLFNAWLEEHDAFGWIEYEDKHEKMVGTEPLRLEE